MPYLSPYQTTMGSTMRTAETAKVVSEELIHSRYIFKDIRQMDDITIRALIHNSAADGFTQPLLIGSRDGMNLIIDQRPFVKQIDDRVTDGDAEPKIINPREYNHNIIRGLLTAVWSTLNRTPFRVELRLAGVVLSKLIANAVANQYRLNLKQRSDIAAVCALYYGSLLRKPGESYDELSKLRDVLKFGQVDERTADAIIKHDVMVPELDNINLLAGMIAKVSDSTKLKSFNSGTLLTLIGNSFFGYNAKENISVSIEYPPTWAAMVYMAYTDRTYKRTTLATTALKLGKDTGDEMEQYVKQVIEDRL